MIDGIDGSGKSTIIEGWVNYLVSQNKKVAYLKDDWKNNGYISEASVYNEYDVIISAEPTTVWVGSAIRQEIIAHNTVYSSLATANAYALDRLILYKRLLVPLLEQGKIIIQDRGVSTSLCYQPIQDQDITIESVIELEGNQLALQHRPDHLIIANIPATSALDRLGGRHEKQDNAQFEKQDFLEKAQQTFLNNKFQEIFSSKGTTMHILNTDVPADIMKQNANALLKSILN